MEPDLAPYLDEFASELDAPARGRGMRGLGLEPVVSPTLPRAVLSQPLVAALPGVYRTSAEALELRLIAQGLFSNLPPPPVPPPATPANWTANVRAAVIHTDELEQQVLRLRATAATKTARTEHPDAHIQNNYTWLQYRIPASGLCDPAQLVWLDVWFRARQLLKWLAVPPLRGVTGAIALLWKQTIDRLTALAVESTNIRFFSPPGTAPVAGSLDPGSGLPGLASLAQTRGGYYFARAGETAASWQAMSYAPVPQGGFEELVPDLTRAPAGTTIGTRQGPWVSCSAPPHCTFTPLESELDFFNTLFRLWVERGGTTPPTFTVPVLRRDRRGTVDAQFDLNLWVDGPLRLAKIMSDERVSYQEVLLRSVAFYVNAYLDFGARHGVLPTDVVNTARAQFAAIQGAANDAINTAVATGAGVVVAVVTAINAAAGAIVGIVLGLLQGILGSQGAATGTGPTVPYPFYLRVFGGSCMDRSWMPPPSGRLAGTRPTATVTATVVPPAETPSTGAAGGGKVFGVGAILLGLALLFGRK